VLGFGGSASGQFVEADVEYRLFGDSVSFEAMDLDGLRAARNDAVGVPTQFAVRQDVAFSARDVGVVEDTADGRKVWRFRVEAANAMNINLAMDWDVPPSTQMFLLNDRGEQRFHTFGFEDNQDHGELWTPPVGGSFVELYAEVDADEIDAFLDGVSIFKVNLGFARFGEAAGAAVDAGDRSDSCHVDVNCPQGDAWTDQINGTGILGSGGFTFCSGSLVNNTAEDGTPLLLSAFHCFGNDASQPGNVPSLFVVWNFQNSVCRTPGSPSSGGNGNGDFNDATTGGAVIRARISTADVVVYELNNVPSVSFNVPYLGWDRRNVSPGPTISTHHPSGDEKRISIDNQTPFQTNINFFDQANIRTWATQFDQGGTEGGSSGGPLFNQSNGRVIAVLSGGINGEPACFPATQFYGRLDYAWTRGTPQTVGQVLDPVGNGSAQTLDLLGGGDEPPGAFGAVFPTAGETGVSTTATFDWDTSPFASTYDLTISEDSAGNDVVFSISGLTQSSYTLPGGAIDSYSDYFWSVVANNDNGTRTITLGNIPFSTENAGRPAGYDVLFPFDGATDVAVDTGFIWEAAGGADFYQLRIFNDDTGVELWGPGDGNINSTSFSLPFDLPAGTAVRWGVIARNGSGFTFSDPTFSTFTTAGDVVPPCPTDVEPDGNIDLADLLLVLANFGQSGFDAFTNGDTDGDGDVELDDLLAVLADFGTSCP
jgi:hypothetical protein